MILNSTWYPQICIFTLEYVIWPFRVDSDEHKTPITELSNGTIIDRENKPVVPYEDVPKIFNRLNRKGVKIGLISSCAELGRSDLLIFYFGWRKYISFHEIYPASSKYQQIQRIHSDSMVEYSDMIYFDSYLDDIYDVGKLGVTGVYVPNGITLKNFTQAIKDEAKRRRRKTTMSDIDRQRLYREMYTNDPFYISRKQMYEELRDLSPRTPTRSFV